MKNQKKKKIAWSPKQCNAIFYCVSRIDFFLLKSAKRIYSNNEIGATSLVLRNINYSVFVVDITNNIIACSAILLLLLLCGAPIRSKLLNGAAVQIGNNRIKISKF